MPWFRVPFVLGAEELALLLVPNRSTLNNVNIMLTIDIVNTRNTRRRLIEKFWGWHVLRIPSKTRGSFGENRITAGRNSDRTKELANLDDQANLSRTRFTSWGILNELTAERNILRSQFALIFWTKHRCPTSFLFFFPTLLLKFPIITSVSPQVEIGIKMSSRDSSERSN